jgi:hypothetical protein
MSHEATNAKGAIMIRSLGSIAAALLAIIAFGVITASSAEPAELPEFTAGEYPAKISATSTKGTEVFHAFGETVECEHTVLQAELASGPSPELEFIPKYTGCISSGGFFTTYNFTSCHFVMTRPATIIKHTFTTLVHIKCTNPKDKIHMEFYTSEAGDTKGEKRLCTATIDPWTFEAHFIIKTATGDIEMLGTSAEGITATQTRESPLCPAGTHTSEGKYTITKPIVLQATNKSEKHINFDIG